jgi:hypothetical protein
MLIEQDNGRDRRPSVDDRDPECLLQLRDNGVNRVALIEKVGSATEGRKIVRHPDDIGASGL